MEADHPLMTQRICTPPPRRSLAQAASSPCLNNITPSAGKPQAASCSPDDSGGMSINARKQASSSASLKGFLSTGTSRYRGSISPSQAVTNANGIGGESYPDRYRSMTRFTSAPQ